MTAQVPEIVQEFISEIKAECPICFESSNVELKLFPCQHYACTHCIEGLLTEGSFSCPVCRQAIQNPFDLQTYRYGIRVNDCVTRLQEQIAENHQSRTDGVFSARDEERERTPLLQQEWTEQTQQQRVDADLYDIIDSETRCHPCCHRACGLCCLAFRDNIHETFSVFNHGETDEEPNSAFCLPFWICCLCKTIGPCVGVFSVNGEFKQESSTACKTRTLSRTCILKTQPPLLPIWLRQLWSITMLLVMLSGIVWPITTGNDSGRFTHVIIIALSCSLSVIWLILVIQNFANYRPTQSEPIKKEDNCVSYFAMELGQQVFSEFSLYPQLILAATRISCSSFTNPVIIPFTILFCLLQVIYVLRIYTVIRMRDYVRLYLKRLIFFLVTNEISITFLLAILVISPIQFHICLSLLVLVNSVINAPMFYLSHLYDISLQSAVNVISLSQSALEIRNSKFLIHKLINLETFHKNMYTLSMGLFGSLFYFWIIPSTLVTFWLYDSHIFGVVVSWYSFYLFSNYKSFLYSCATHFTAVVILLLMISVFLLSVVAAVIALAVAIILAVFYILYYLALLLCKIICLMFEYPAIPVCLVILGLIVGLIVLVPRIHVCFIFCK